MMNTMENVEMHEINKKVDEIGNKLDNHALDIKTIREALIGSEYAGKGLVSRVEQNVSDIIELQNKWNFVKYALIGAGLGGGITLAKIASMIGSAIK